MANKRISNKALFWWTAALLTGTSLPPPFSGLCLIASGAMGIWFIFRMLFEDAVFVPNTDPIDFDTLGPTSLDPRSPWQSEAPPAPEIPDYFH